MTPVEKSRVLLGSLLEVSDVVISATRSDNKNQLTRAKALILSVQLDIVSSYIILCESPYGEPSISKALLIRPLIELTANWNHIGTDKKLAIDFIDYSSEIAKAIKEHIEQRQGLRGSLSKPQLWTGSYVEQRVKKLDLTLFHMYDYLSNFIHGNNILDQIKNEKTLVAFNKAMDSAFISLLSRVVIDVGLSFELSDEQHKSLLKSLDDTKPEISEVE